MVSELCSGPCIAMEIRQFDPSKVFRDFCGPSDPVSTFLSDKESLKNWWAKWIKMSKCVLVATCLLHSLETCQSYYRGQMLALVDQFANPLATLLSLPKPDNKILWWHLCEKKVI